MAQTPGDNYSNIENLVLPPGCRPYPTGRKLGQVRDNRLCRESCCKRGRNDGILECWNTEDPRLAEWDLFL